VTRRFIPAARALPAAITLTLTAFMASVVPAAATPGEPPQSGDVRATVHPGNAVTCEDAGLAGELIDVEFQVDETNHFIDIVSVPSDIELTGIVVKGGPAYNVYGPAENLGLHSPLVPGGVAEISHWYACGQELSTTDTQTADTESPQNGENASDEESADTNTDETEVSDATVEAASTSPGGSATADSDAGNLANTGFSGRWLLLAGTALLAIGLGLVFGVRASRRRGDSTSS